MGNLSAEIGEGLNFGKLFGDLEVRLKDTNIEMVRSEEEVDGKLIVTLVFSKK